MANFKFDLLRSNGTDYDTLYPKTIWSQIEPTTIPSTFTPTSHSHNATDITQTSSYRFVTDAEKTTWNAKQSALTNPVTGTGTASTLAYWNGTGTIASLATATYPSLTEIGYVKGVTSAIQSQISGKASSTHAHGNIGTGGTITSAIVTTATDDCILISDATNSGKIERGIAFNTTHGNAFLRKDGTWAVPPDNNSGGTVTSVGGTGTVSGITLSGTVTTTGNLTLGGTLSVAASNFSSQTAKTFLAAPVAAAGVPTFRAIDASDIPTLNQSTTGNAATATKLASILTSFSGSYPLTVNVSGVIYSHSNMTFTGSTGVLAAPVFAEGGTSLTDKYAAKTHTHGYATSSTPGFVRISVSGTTVNIITS